MTPAASRVRSRAVRMSRDAPVLRAMASNLRLPKLISRMASIAHFSPTTWSALASEQGLPGLVAVTPQGCHIQLTAATGVASRRTPSHRCDTGSMNGTVVPLLRDLVDDAGLFPPTQLPMADA